jgi:hypothetical protein
MAGVSVYPDEEFIEMFNRLGGTETAKEMGLSVRSVLSRRRNLEKKYDIELFGPEQNVNDWRHESRKRLEIDIDDGVIFVGSDFHYWPGYVSVAHRAFVRLCRLMRPRYLIANGDLMDGASLSRFPPTGWTKAPTVQEELQTVQERLEEIEASQPLAERIWLWGNHDYRFESKLAQQASSFEGVKGFALPDHFPKWKFGISLRINEDVVVKHRFKGGVHATHNNTVNAGLSIVTGHLHSLKVTPFDDYNGTRFGVDTGTMNDPHGPHTEYVEDNPLNHRSGFVILTFHKRKLLWPEIVQVIGHKQFQFRGRVYEV